MEKTNLKAIERSEKPNKVRKAGLIPGVLNGPGGISTSVKFENAPLNKIISKHGVNAKVWLELDNEKKFGFIKEIQKNPVSGKIIHVTIQLVSMDQEVKMQIPINFHGHTELGRKSLQLQIAKPDVSVMGKTALMPDLVVVEVADKQSGDNITASDFTLPSEITILDPDDEVYAFIRDIKENIIEEEPEAGAEEEIQPAAE